MQIKFLDLEHNLHGNDWFCGDLHGTFEELMNSLEIAGFDETNDRLFCVGDLHDRGPDSLKCLGLLGCPWFYTVDCNHNELLSEYVRGALSEADMRQRGAGWFVEKHRRDQVRILDVLEGLPTVIRIAKGSQARVNLFHAEFLGDDSQLDEACNVQSGGSVIDCKTSLLWGRILAEELKSGEQAIHMCSSGLSPSFVGHSVMLYPHEYKNHIFMDCGTWSKTVKSVQQGLGPLNFPLYCLGLNQWHFCSVEKSTIQYTNSLHERVENHLFWRKTQNDIMY